MPQNIIVVGMPRSGTSMLAGIFARMGFFVSDAPNVELLQPDTNNPGGYWESAPLISRNVEVLEAAGYDHHNTWMFDSIETEQVEKIAQLSPLPGHDEFISRFGAGSPWLWKDPRLCYTLPYWMKLLDPNTTRILLIERDPIAIYRSFVRVGWRDSSSEARTEVIQRVSDHLDAARRALASAPVPYLTLNYEEFGADRRGSAKKLSEFLEMSLLDSDLGFDSRLDHSTLMGRIRTLLERFVDGIPGPVRRGAKRLMPRRLLRLLLPGWKT